MLVEIAIADAYGAGFEFCSEEKIILHNDLTKYCNHELYKFSGKYTDDTQMSIAIAEFILSKEPWTKNNISSKFLECFKRDVRLGYSDGFYHLLSSVASGEELMKRLIVSSDRNGAAMRSVPIGFLKNKIDVISFAELQAKVTHDTVLGVSSSCAVALAAYFGLQKKGNLIDLQSFLCKEGFGKWDFNWNTRVAISAYDTVSAALSCLLRHNSLSSLLKACVDLGGDTDSVASIAVGLATCFLEYKKDLPYNLLKQLDEKQYGISFLKKIDEELDSY